MKLIAVFLFFGCSSGTLGAFAFARPRSGAADAEFEGLSDCPVDASHNDVLNDCLALAMNGIRPIFAKGIPSLGVAAADPIHVPNIPIYPLGGADGPIKFSLTDMEVIGMSNYDRTWVTLDNTTKTLGLTFQYPKFRFNMRYKLEISGRLLGGRRQPLTLTGRYRALVNNMYNNFTIHFIQDAAGGKTLKPVLEKWTGSYQDVQLDLLDLKESGRLGATLNAAAKGGLKWFYDWCLKNVFVDEAIHVYGGEKSFITAISYYFIPYFDN